MFPQIASDQIEIISERQRDKGLTIQTVTITSFMAYDPAAKTQKNSL